MGLLHGAVTSPLLALHTRLLRSPMRQLPAHKVVSQGMTRQESLVPEVVLGVLGCW